MNKRSFGLHKKYATIYGVSQQGHVRLKEAPPSRAIAHLGALHPEA